MVVHQSYKHGNGMRYIQYIDINYSRCSSPLVVILIFTFPHALLMITLVCGDDGGEGCVSMPLLLFSLLCLRSVQSINR